MTDELPEGELPEIEGNLLKPDDDGFDEARALWNTRFDRSPDVVVRCTAVDDVVEAVVQGRSNGMTLSVMGGGHSYAASTVGDGGILIDMSQMRALTIDPEKRTATIVGPITCAELDQASQKHGLATPLPTVSSVGVIGAALGGGAGYLSRKFGLTLDNIISAEVITADGQVVPASSDTNQDLFWAIRGGGGNYGVVSRLDLQLHPLGPQVLAGQIIYPFDRAGEHLRFFREFMADAPDEFQCYPFCFKIPPIDLFPEETHGMPVLDFVVFHHDAGAAEFVEPLRNLDEAILNLVGPTPYVEAQTAFDPNLPKGQRYISKAHDLDGLSDGAIDTMVEYVPRMEGALTAAYFDPLGGAVGRIDSDVTAYRGRNTSYGFHIIAGWFNQGDDDAVIGWANAFQDAMESNSTGGVYVNLIADDESERVPAAYGDNYARLVQLKQKWDPTNLFANNYNIVP